MDNRAFLLGMMVTTMTVLIMMPVSDVYSLRQMAGIPEVMVYPGGAEEFTWGLVSDSTDQDTIVNIRAEGAGAEFLVYPKSVLLEPGATQYVTILVEIPENHKEMTSYSPSLYATELGEKGDAVVINISMEKQVNITVVETPLIDAPKDVMVQEQRMQENKIDSDKGGGCLVATAAYGTEMAPQVQMLREIRDNKLMQTESGKLFMDSFSVIYYSFSPIIADYQRENDYFNEMVQLLITPMISTLYIMEYADSESQVITHGISVITLNGLLYLGAPAVAATIFARKVLQR